MEYVVLKRRLWLGEVNYWCSCHNIMSRQSDQENKIEDPDCSLKINKAILKIFSQEFATTDSQYWLTKIENSKMCVED